MEDNSDNSPVFIVEKFIVHGEQSHESSVTVQCDEIPMTPLCTVYYGTQKKKVYKYAWEEIGSGVKGRN
jgi:hypothetical protein